MHRKLPFRAALSHLSGTSPWCIIQAVSSLDSSNCAAVA
jgi:hypothetical protein